ncbi:MAG: LemA family protein [Bacteroidota bacterium]
MDAVFVLLAVGFTVSLALLGWGVVLYNRLVRLRERFRNAFAQIDVQLRRRHDLVPMLVETVRGYLAHERATLEAVIRARAAAVQAEAAATKQPGQAGPMAALQQAESSLGSALGRLLAVSEAYPQLEADQQMRDLREELTSTENRIAFARQHYNDAVTRYNTDCEVVPNVFVARAAGFETAALLHLERAEMAEAPAVSLTA